MLEWRKSPFAASGSFELSLYEFSWQSYAKQMAIPLTGVFFDQHVTAQDEKSAFQWLVDAMTARLGGFPAIHVFHFGVYEPAKFRYLMGRYRSL